MGRPKGSKNKKKVVTKESLGVGDAIEKITEATGIKAVVKKVFGDDCGCEERKEKLNKIFSKPVVACFTEQQYNLYSKLKPTLKGTLDKHQLNNINTLSKAIFNIDILDSNCVGCNGSEIKDIVNKLNILFETYDI